MGTNPTTKPTAGSDNKVEEQSIAAERAAEANAPYTDKRTVVISLVHNYSMYRRANMKVMGHKKETIGSSITSCRILSSNKTEIETYFPALIGVSPSNPDFVSRVKAYLSNIQFTVSNDNAPLNTSFVYDHKSDYEKIKVQEDAINEAYEKIDKSNLKAVKDALKIKIEALNTLETSKCTLGHPENVEEYIIYRHCLLYKDVAKDLSLINSDPSIRFYIKDEAKEQEKARKLLREKKDAMQNCIEVFGNDAKFNAVYVQICLVKGHPVIEYSLKNREDKENIVMAYATENPDKFNKFVKDKHLTTKSFIEVLISKGELIRSEYNQQISTADGTYVGANITEAVAFFNNADNEELKKAYEKKMNLF